LDVEGFNATMLLPAMAGLAGGLGAVDGPLGGTDRFDAGVQGLLVGFDLDDEKVPGLPGGLKCFFDSAWHRR
jgi:hypothetical protein